MHDDAADGDDELPAAEMIPPLEFFYIYISLLLLFIIIIQPMDCAHLNSSAIGLCSFYCLQLFPAEISLLG
jgi:hypothetical protein